jgi:AAA+ superfamily predicted ATPase
MRKVEITDLEFNSQILQAKGGLSGLVTTFEKELAEHKKTANEADREIYASVLNTFVGSYLSIESKLQNSDFLEDEKNRSKIVRNLAAYSAAKATMNLLYDKKIQQLWDSESNHYVDRCYLSDRHDISLLESVLKNAAEAIRDCEFARYELFKYFNQVRADRKSAIFKGKNEKERQALAKELLDVKIVKDDLNFSEIEQLEQKKEQQPDTAKSEIGKYIPDEIPEYCCTKDVDFNDCVGNVESIEHILNAVLMVLRYNPNKKENDFLGIGFPTNFIIYGPPGVGKSMALDAIVKWANNTAQKYSKPLCVTNMTSAIKTCMFDMSGKILEEFYKREEKGDKIYINIFDENGGGKFYNSNKEGGHKEDSKFLETAKNVMGKKYKGNVINIIVTNYIDDEQFEAAFKQRFGKKIKFEGPKTAEDFGKVMKHELKTLVDLKVVSEDVKWDAVGSVFVEYKRRYQHLEKKGLFITPRICEKVAENMNGVGKLYRRDVLLDEQKWPKSKLHAAYCQLHCKLHGPISEEYILRKVHEQIGEEIKASTEARYNAETTEEVA